MNMAEQTTNQTGQTMGEPVNEEIGRDESWFARVASEKDAWFSNQKRTYDAYQQVDLKQISDAQQYENQRQVLATQALQNAVETANMVGKQALRHAELAIDRQWNLEVSQAAGEGVVMRSVTIDDASLKAIAAAVAMAISDALATKQSS
jgi:hypothetical protein